MKILDATSGDRSIWFDKKHPLATYIDIRPEMKPDLVMDCTNTTFKEKEFDLIIFDPPHVSLSKNNKGIFGKRYGKFNAQEIRDLISKGFSEFDRILKDNGLVLFKWNDHDQKLDKILKLIDDFEPLFGHKVSMRTKHKSQTYWVCLKKLK